MVRLTHTRWKGTVCHSRTASITATLAAAKTAHSSSGQHGTTRERITDIADRVDGGAPELRAQARDADLHHVGAEVERTAPDVLEQLGPGADPPLVEREMLEQEELARRERNRPVTRIGGAAN